MFPNSDTKNIPFIRSFDYYRPRETIQEFRARFQEYRGREVTADTELMADTYLSATAPIRKLPVELMQKIFEETTFCNVDLSSFDNLPRSADNIAMYKAPLLLLRVCRQWRRIVLDMPSLFSQVIVTNPWTGHSLELLRLWLQFSESSPLEIYFKNRNSDISAFEVFQPHLHRIKVLYISKIWYLLPLLRPKTVSYAPNLLYLQIDGYGHESTTRNRGTLHATNLRSFRYRGRFPWRGLITFGNKLEQFVSEGCPGELKELPRLLSNNTNITTIGFYHAGNYRGQARRPSNFIHLSRLQVLRISWRTATGISELLRMIYTPTLEELCLESKRSWRAEAPMPPQDNIVYDTLSLIERSEAKLKALTLRLARFDMEQLGPLLRATSYLKALSLREKRLHKRILDLLSSISGSQWEVCPELETLCLENVSRVEHDFRTMIRNRLQGLPSDTSDDCRVVLKKIDYYSEHILRCHDLEAEFPDADVQRHSVKRVPGHNL
ncbi:hypothetical protein M422DRAFT_41393 [Sphaerobolus stellatus SS14]|nr:hypothetical protein M422DRAFT_41393 [Sphaerobolus stellatus SS14]